MTYSAFFFLIGIGGFQLLLRYSDWDPQAYGGVAIIALQLSFGAYWLMSRRRHIRNWNSQDGEVKEEARTMLLRLAFWVALGFSWVTLLAAQRLADHLDPAWEGKDVLLTGVVAELPQEFGRGERFIFRVEEVSPPTARVPRKIALSWYRGRGSEEMPGWRPRPGQRWQLTARLKLPHGNANPHGFDYEAWLFERGIRATGYVRPGEKLLLEERVPGFFLEVERLRDAVRRRFQQELPARDYPYGGILSALAMGDQQAIPGEQWQVFARSGTTHLMSISGLHVTLLAWLVAGVAGFLWRRSSVLPLYWATPKLAMLAGVGAAFLYTCFAGFAVPAQRTLYMLGVALLVRLSGRPVSPGRTLELALLTVLILDPWAPLSPGFWLSFVAVAALLFALAYRVGGTAGTTQAESLLLRGDEPGKWSGRGILLSFKTFLGKKLGAWGLSQWVATLATLPLGLWFFQQFSLVSPLANALAIPLISGLITPLALLAVTLPSSGILPLAHGLLGILMDVLRGLAAPDWVIWTPPAIPWPLAVLAMLAVGLACLPRGVPGRHVAWLLLMPLLLLRPPRPGLGQLWVDVLDVGQGLAVVLRTTHYTLLYDTGPYYSAESDAGQRIVVPYLRAQGIHRLDGMIVTHKDKDHSGGALSVLEAVPVVWMADSLSGEEALWLHRHAPQRRPCFSGQNWEWDGVRFTMLHPRWENYGSTKGKANHMSCVLRVEAGGRSVLLTADIEKEDEVALLADPHRRALLKADYLLVPHHGSGTSSTPAFLDAVSPAAALVPVGYRNRFNHPKTEVLARYEERGIALWRTDRHGALLLKLGGRGRGEEELVAWREKR